MHADRRTIIRISETDQRNVKKKAFVRYIDSIFFTLVRNYTTRAISLFRRLIEMAEPYRRIQQLIESNNKNGKI